MIPTGQALVDLLTESAGHPSEEMQAEMTSLLDDMDTMFYLATNLQSFIERLFIDMVEDGMSVPDAMKNSALAATTVFFKGAFDAGREHEKRQAEAFRTTLGDLG